MLALHALAGIGSLKFPLLPLCCAVTAEDFEESYTPQCVRDPCTSKRLSKLGPVDRQTLMHDLDQIPRAEGTDHPADYVQGHQAGLHAFVEPFGSLIFSKVSHAIFIHAVVVRHCHRQQGKVIAARKPTQNSSPS